MLHNTTKRQYPIRTIMIIARCSCPNQSFEADVALVLIGTHQIAYCSRWHRANILLASFVTSSKQCNHIRLCPSPIHTSHNNLWELENKQKKYCNTRTKKRWRAMLTLGALSTARAHPIRNGLHIVCRRKNYIHRKV